MATLQVGNGKTYSTIDAAVKAAHDGDTVQVSAGTYKNQYAIINKDLTFTAVGGRVKLESSGNIPNGKAIFVIGEGNSSPDVTINGFDFSGAKVNDKNGAGIRLTTGNLTLNNNGFYNNEMGVLTGNLGEGSVTINNSEFASAENHNLYIGRIEKLTVDGSYFHDAKKGHELKSRADNNIIKNSRIFDNNSTASYSIDLAEGGNATIENNVIQQGPNSPNSTIISYGAEGNLNPGTNFVIKNNDIVNEKNTMGAIGLRNYTKVTAQIIDNDFYGLSDTQIAYGNNAESGSTFLTSKPNLDKSSPVSGNTNPPPIDPDPDPKPPVVNPPPKPDPDPDHGNIPTDNASLWSYAKAHPDDVEKLTLDLNFRTGSNKIELILELDPDGSGPEPAKDYKTTMKDAKGSDWNFVLSYIKDPDNRLYGLPRYSEGSMSLSFIPDTHTSFLSTDKLSM